MEKTSNLENIVTNPSAYEWRSLTPHIPTSEERTKCHYKPSDFDCSKAKPHEYKTHDYSCAECPYHPRSKNYNSR